MGTASTSINANRSTRSPFFPLFLRTVNRPRSFQPVFIHMLNESCTSSGVNPYSPMDSARVSWQLVCFSSPHVDSKNSGLHLEPSKSVTHVSAISSISIIRLLRGGLLST
jgi:hypothetical protein